MIILNKRNYDITLVQELLDELITDLGAVKTALKEKGLKVSIKIEIVVFNFSKIDVE